MGLVTYSNLFKVLEWVIVGTLVLCSGWFMTDVWEKFQSKKTSYTQYSETISEFPSIVVCMDPYVKPSGLKKYDIGVSNFAYSTLPKLNISWDEFKEDVFYILGKDFFLYYEFADIEQNEKFTVETLLTFWAGLCYKIKINYFDPNAWLYFSISWDTYIDAYEPRSTGNFSRDDVPKVK